MTASVLRGSERQRRSRTSSEDDGPLRVVVQLRDELRAKAVRFCHWKSNDMLARSLSGENDLHLLVHRDDARRFLSVLARLGFNRAVAQSGREHPGSLTSTGSTERVVGSSTSTPTSSSSWVTTRPRTIDCRSRRRTSPRPATMRHCPHRPWSSSWRCSWSG